MGSPPSRPRSLRILGTHSHPNPSCITSLTARTQVLVAQSMSGEPRQERLPHSVPQCPHP